jgi:hypothetical protein
VAKFHDIYSGDISGQPPSGPVLECARRRDIKINNAAWRGLAYIQPVAAVCFRRFLKRYNLNFDVPK